MTTLLVMSTAIFLDANSTANGSASDMAGGLAAAMAGMGVVGLLIVLAGLVVGIIAYWRIAEKAGYAGAMSLLMLIPLVNLIIFLIFAFSEWPIEARLRMAGTGARPPGAL
jgi:hypothetical protein